MEPSPPVLSPRCRGTEAMGGAGRHGPDFLQEVVQISVNHSNKGSQKLGSGTNTFLERQHSPTDHPKGGLLSCYPKGDDGWMNQGSVWFVCCCCCCCFGLSDFIHFKCCWNSSQPGMRTDYPLDWGEAAKEDASALISPHLGSFHLHEACIFTCSRVQQ